MISKDCINIIREYYDHPRLRLVSHDWSDEKESWKDIRNLQKRDLIVFDPERLSRLLNALDTYKDPAEYMIQRFGLNNLKKFLLKDPENIQAVDLYEKLFNENILLDPYSHVSYHINVSKKMTVDPRVNTPDVYSLIVSLFLMIVGIIIVAVLFSLQVQRQSVFLYGYTIIYIGFLHVISSSIDLLYRVFRNPGRLYSESSYIVSRMV